MASCLQGETKEFPLVNNLYETMFQKMQGENNEI